MAIPLNSSLPLFLHPIPLTSAFFLLFFTNSTFFCSAQTRLFKLSHNSAGKIDVWRLLVQQPKILFSPTAFRTNPCHIHTHTHTHTHLILTVPFTNHPTSQVVHTSGMIAMLFSKQESTGYKWERELRRWLDMLANLHSSHSRNNERMEYTVTHLPIPIDTLASFFLLPRIYFCLKKRKTNSNTVVIPDMKISGASTLPVLILLS